jgi:cardiolipin synthase
MERVMPSKPAVFLPADDGAAAPALIGSTAPKESPPPRRGGALAWAALLLATMVGACSSAPPRAPAQAAKPVSLQDRNGVVPAAVAARDLAQLRDEGRPALVQHQLDVLAAAGEANLYRGNAARLLIDGPPTFAAMKGAIAGARHRVLLQSYIVEDQGVAAEFADLLLLKAAQGISVALIYDAIGSLETSAAYFDRLRAGGVAVCAYNPVNPVERVGHRGLLQRSHRKLLAVDSDVAYTGGINLSKVYAEGSSGSRRRASPAPPAGWRDTQIELRGAVVAGIAAVFRLTWQAQGCPGELVPEPPQQQDRPGARVVKLVAADPKQGITPATPRCWRRWPRRSAAST